MSRSVLKFSLLRNFQGCCLLFNYQGSVGCCRVSTAILDYHMFCRLSTTFFIFFWNLFFSTFIAFFRFHISDAFCCFPVTLLSAFYINISNSTCQLFLFSTFQLHTVFTCQFFTMSSICWYFMVNGERGIWTLAPLLTIYSLSRGAPSATWVFLQNAFRSFGIRKPPMIDWWFS